MAERIAFIEEAAEIGGAEVNLLHLLAFIKESAHQAWVVVPCEGPLTQELSRRGFEYAVLKQPRLRPSSMFIMGHKVFNPCSVILNLILMVRIVFLLQKWLRGQGITLVQTNCMYAHLYGGVAAKLTGLTCIWHMQDIVDEKQFFGMVRHFVVTCGRFLPQLIVSVSRATDSMFAKLPSDRHCVIYNGVDTQRFHPRNIPCPRTSLGIPDDHKVVGHVGRIVHWKGHRQFIQAARQVHERRKRVSFLIVGAPTFGDAAYVRDLEDMVAREPKPHVVFTGARDDIPELMALMDVYVHSSILPEPFGLVIAEAMASGTAVIASNMGGPTEIIEDGRTGLLVDPHNTAKLADTVCRLIDDDSLADQISEEGRQHIAKHFSLQSFQSQFLARYDTNQHHRKQTTKT